MIYELFFKWLFRARHCDHQWIESGVSYSELRLMWLSETAFRHHFRCAKCKKKKTLLPREVPSKFGTTIYN